MPWIGQSPELISGEHHRDIGKTRVLYDFYTDRQTDLQGRVYYGKPITYRWIAKQIHEKCKGPREKCGCPSIRTLERYNRQLREKGYIRTKTIIRDKEAIGFSVTIQNQTKFNDRREPQQIRLFHAPVQISVQKQWVDESRVPTGLSTGVVKSVGVKDLKKETGGERNEQTPRAVRASSPPAVNAQAKPQFDRAWRQQQKARRILREIELTRELYIGAFGDSALRRDAELEKLYSELRRTGWQDARAG